MNGTMKPINPFVLKGAPVPKERPRVTRNGTYTPQRTLDHEEKLAAQFRRANVGFGLPDPLFEFELTVNFVKARNGRPDIDNMLKCLMDGLQGTVYKDDAQVTKVIMDEWVEPKDPRTEVWLRRRIERFK